MVSEDSHHRFVGAVDVFQININMQEHNISVYDCALYVTDGRGAVKRRLDPGRFTAPSPAEC